MTTDKYKLLRECGLSVFDPAAFTPSLEYWVYANDVLSMIEQGTVVAGTQHPSEKKDDGQPVWNWHNRSPKLNPDTHAARLINIQPIVRDTANDLLELLRLYFNSYPNMLQSSEILKQAKRLLEEKK